MKEEPSDTKPLKRVTNKLEQLPSSKKRTLNTDLLATPLTHRLDDASPKNDLSSFSPSTMPLRSVHEPTSTEIANPIETKELDSSSTTGHANKVVAINKDTQPKIAKETVRESSKEVVQEILKEVAEEVAKENAVKAAINISKEPLAETKKVNKELAKEAKEFLHTKPPATTPFVKQDPVVGLGQTRQSSSFWSEHSLEPVEPVKTVTSNKDKRVERSQDTLPEKVTESTDSLLGADNSIAVIEDKLNVIGDKLDTQIEMPLFNSINKFSYSAPEVKTTKAKVKSLVLWSVPLLVLLMASVSIVYMVPALREKVAEKLPLNVASTLGLATKQISQVSIQEYRYSIDEKENTVKISGIVKNLSNYPVGPLQLEFQLTKRGDATLTETKSVTLDPAELAPK
ncbi:MAG: hypothetical protein FD167_5046, partial [bacterium]